MSRVSASKPRPWPKPVTNKHGHNSVTMKNLMKFHWLAALLLVVEKNEPTMLVRIGIMR